MMTAVFVNIVVVFLFSTYQKAEPPYGLLDDEGYLIILKDYAPVNFLFLLKDSTPPIDVESNFEHLLTSVQDGAF